MAITLLAPGGITTPKKKEEPVPLPNPGIPALPSTTVNATTETNPYQKETYDEQKKLLGELPGLKNQEAIDAQARQRDVLANNLADVRSSVGARGFGINSGVNEVLQGKAAMAGAQEQTKLNRDLTADATAARLGLLGTMGGQSSNIAGAQTQQLQTVLDAQARAQQQQLAQWQAIQDQLNNRFNQTMQVYSNPNIKTPTTSGSGFNAGAKSTYKNFKTSKAPNASPFSIVAGGGPTGGFTFG